MDGKREDREMAQRKKTPARKPASRKPAAPKGSRARPDNEAAASARHQMAAVLLFAGAILVLCLALIKGANLWLWLHNLMMGLFGVCAYILPVLMGYIAVIAAMERPIGSMRGKLWQCLLLLMMLGSAIHVFTADIAEGHSYFDAIGRAWKDGIAIRGGGVAGVLLGYPLEYFFTDVGAKIILCLLIFVFLMLVTGTTILTLFRTVWKPVKKTKESIENAMIAGADRRRNAAIDVELGEGYPELSVPLDGEEEPGGDGELADKLAALQKTAADMADAEKASPRVEDLLTKKGPVKGL